jgi:hypothetical protein
MNGNQAAMLSAVAAGSRPNGKARRGAMLLETTVAMVILLVAMLAVAQTVATVAVQRRVAEQRALATQEAANLMERVYSLPWDEATEDKISEMQLSETCRQRLPDARLGVVVESAGERVPGREIRIEIDWQDRAGRRSAPVRLTAWKYAQQEANP